MMWLFLLLCIAHTEPVSSQDENHRLILRGKKVCEGHVEILHRGVWGYVGDKDWDSNTDAVVCRSARCGKPVSTWDVLRPYDMRVWLNEIKCNGTANHLWECDYPGWDISYYPKDSMKSIKCSSNISIRLEGFKCAGAVKYTNGGHSGYFCAENWGPNEANLLCQDLGCGSSMEIPELEWMVWEEFKNSEKMTIDCSGIYSVDNLWQCVTSESKSCSMPASVICTGHRKLRLTGKSPNVCSGQLERERNGKWFPVTKGDYYSSWCKQMNCGTTGNGTSNNTGVQLLCKDTVSLVLMDNNKPSKCYGTVHINVDNSSHPVCASNWNEQEAKVVCKELNCGDLVTFSRSSLREKKGIMDNVKCHGNESSLWHCRAKYDKKLLSCSSFAHVICADSTNVRLSDGPGKCAGRVEIQYGGEWHQASQDGWTETNSDVVCTQLNCGRRRISGNLEIFSPGSANFLDSTVECNSNAKRINECFSNKNLPRGNNRAVSLTCEQHEMMFLKGGVCAGMVGIQRDSKTYWLSGSNATWNNVSANAVCQQMHCGEATDFQNFPLIDMTEDNEKILYRCSYINTSLFQCEEMTTNFNDTIAHVTCSGNITVSLTEQCRGDVNICFGGNCGGVYKDTWTDEKSVMLCENLGCGSKILKPRNFNLGGVIVKSLHTTNHTTNLNESVFVKMDGENAYQAYVICIGSVKVRLNASSSKCSGELQVLYDDKWLPACNDAFADTETQNTICKQESCGKAIQIFDLGQTSAKSVISQIKCSTDGDTLDSCDFTYEQKTCVLGSLRCSNWRKMELKFGDACKGAVFVHSEGQKSAISPQGWTASEGERLCQDLECGGYKSVGESPWYSPLWNGNFNCTGVENGQNIWDCENQTLSSNTNPRTQKDKNTSLFIECKDDPKVSLSNDCSGEVMIYNRKVCGNRWNIKYAHMVCQEMNCGNAMSFSNGVSKDKNYHVVCEDYHHRLGQCKRWEAECDEGPVSVFCVGNIKFTTTEECGGELKVKYDKNWESVYENSSLNTLQKDHLCNKELNCIGWNETSSNRNYRRTERGSVKTAYSCNVNHKYIRNCIFPKSADAVPRATIYCNGYKEPSPPAQSSTPPVGLIVLGVGLILILVILVVVFVRVCIIKKTKRPMSVSEAEFESGNYEDVMDKEYETDDFGHDKVFAEGDKRSTSSLHRPASYDDIGEEAEAQPLTSQEPAGASGDDANYEVDDPRDSYDDIEASPEISQTEAEVHNTPQTTPDSDAVSGLSQGGEDYLVPGEDG